jgi:hypothetical protein
MARANSRFAGYGHYVAAGGTSYPLRLRVPEDLREALGRKYGHISFDPDDLRTAESWKTMFDDRGVEVLYVRGHNGKLAPGSP